MRESRGATQSHRDTSVNTVALPAPHHTTDWEIFSKYLANIYQSSYSYFLYLPLLIAFKLILKGCAKDSMEFSGGIENLFLSKLNEICRFGEDQRWETKWQEID